MSPALDLLARASAILLLGLAVRALLWNRSAEVRSTVLRTTLVGLALLAVVSLAGLRVEPVLPGPKPNPIVVDAGWLIEAQGLSITPAQTSETPWPPIVWGGLALLALAGPVAGTVALRRLWNRSRSVSAPEWDELRGALAEIGVTVMRRERARVGNVATPLVYGAFQPKLLLPEGFSQWPESHRRFALLHEAAHLKRFDCAWLALANAVRAVYACHPLAWWLSRALSDEAELAADERAIRSGVEATDYASALIAIARDLQRPGRLVHSQGVTFMNHRQLDRRVRGVLSARRRGSSLIGLLALATSFFASTVGIALLHPKAAEPDILIAQDAVAPQRATAPAKPAAKARVPAKVKQAKSPKPGHAAPAASPDSTFSKTAKVAPGTPVAAPDALAAPSASGTPAPAFAPAAVSAPTTGTPAPAPTASPAVAPVPASPFTAAPAQGARKLSEAEMKAIVEEVLRRLKESGKTGDDAKAAIEKQRALLGALTRTGVAVQADAAKREVELARSLMGQAVKVEGRLLDAQREKELARVLSTKTARAQSLFGEAVKVEGKALRLGSTLPAKVAEGTALSGLAVKAQGKALQAERAAAGSLLKTKAQVSKDGLLEIVLVDEKGKQYRLKVKKSRLLSGKPFKIIRGKDGKLHVQH